MNNNLGEFLALLSSAFWAMNSVFTRKAISTLPAMEGIFINITVSLIIVIPAAVVRVLMQGMPPLLVPGIWLFALTGVLSNALGRLLVFNAVGMIGANRATQLRQTEPIFSLLFGFFILGEVLQLPQYVGVFLVLGSIYYLIFGESRAAQPAREQAATREEGLAGVPWGRLAFVLPMLGGMIFSGANLLRKIALDTLPSPLFGLLASSLAGYLVLGIILASRGRLKPVLQAMRVRDPGAVLYMGSGLFATLAWLTMYTALSLTKLSLVAVFGSMAPLFLLLFSHYFLKEETLSRVVIITGMVITVGVVLVAG